MSLRRDIHSAFEVISPPLGGMPERVVQTVLADKKRRRKEEMAVRLRVPLTLVAALLLVAVIAAAVITWNSLHSNVSPVGGVHLTTLQQLEARPVGLPTLAPTDACPQNSGTNPYGYQLGSGPVYADGSSAIATAWGNYFDIPYFTRAGLKGLVLIRGRDLRAASGSVVFVGKYATGRVVGTDPAPEGGTQYNEAALDASHPPRTLVNRDGMWTVRQGLPKDASNCFGFQIDGADFTERFTGGT